MTVPVAQPEMVVRKSIVVNVPQAHAFAVFTEKFGSWWPLESHHIGKPMAETAIIEPRAGGRWFERGVDGAECDWGRVLAWEPPSRVLLSWEISAAFQYDKSIQSEVEVKFLSEGPQTTRVMLEHRKLDQYGEKASMMKAAFDSENGWGSMLQVFASMANGEGV